MVGAATTAKYVFDLQPGDVYWCTADCGCVPCCCHCTVLPWRHVRTAVMLQKFLKPAWLPCLSTYQKKSMCTSELKLTQPW